MVTQILYGEDIVMFLLVFWKGSVVSVSVLCLVGVRGQIFVC